MLHYLPDLSQLYHREGLLDSEAGLLWFTPTPSAVMGADQHFLCGVRVTTPSSPASHFKNLSAVTETACANVNVVVSKLLKVMSGGPTRVNCAIPGSVTLV